MGAEHLESLKFTDSAAFSLSVRDWQALRADADRAGREPRMVIDFELVRLRLVVTESDVVADTEVHTNHGSYLLTVDGWRWQHTRTMRIDFEMAGTRLRLVVTEEPL